MCMNKREIEKNRRNLKLTQNKKTVTHKDTQLQLAAISLFEIEILSSTHR
jgi:PIN domain nuclease of toxin-antitoxin system